MAQDFLTSINLNKNELQNAVVQNLGAEPGSPVEGQIFMHTGSDLLGFYNGAAWVYVGASVSVSWGDIGGTLANQTDLQSALDGKLGVSANAASATLAATVAVVDSTDATSFIAMFDSATGNLAIKTDAGLTYNSTTGMLTATGLTGPLTGNVVGNLTGNVTGNADTATVGTTVAVADTTDATCFVGLFESATGNQGCKTDAGITYSAATGVLTAAGFAGPLTGNVTGNVTGSSGSCTGNAATATLAGTVTVVDSTDATSFIAMFDSATGSLAPKTDAGLTYDSTTASLTVGGDIVIAGNLTVNGTTITANTATLAVEDPMIEMGVGNAANSVDLGFYANYMVAATPQFAGLFRDASDSGKWKLFHLLENEPTTTVNTAGTNYAVATLVASFEGPLIGNASTATALATARAIYGNNFDGTAALAQIIASTFGGTGNGFTKFSGPAAAEKTFTLPNASAAILTDNAAVTVAQGGTGRATSTTAYGLLAAGTTATGAHQTLPLGATTEILVGGGAGALPVWTTATGTGAPVRATSPMLVTPILGTPTSGTLTNCTGPWTKPYTALIGDGVATSFAITQSTHGLAANGALIPDCRRASTGARVYIDISVNAANGTVTFDFGATVPTANQFLIVILG